MGELSSLSYLLAESNNINFVDLHATTKSESSEEEETTSSSKQASKQRRRRAAHHQSPIKKLCHGKGCINISCAVSQHTLI